jgi:branched-chain amino acid transport system substrate-binding protein
MTRRALRKLLHKLSAREAEEIAQLLVHLLERCGDDLTRENVMKEATSLKDVPGDLTLPGIAINTSPTDYRVRKQLQMMKFNGGAGGVEDAGPG